MAMSEARMDGFAQHIADALILTTMKACRRVTERLHPDRLPDFDEANGEFIAELEAREGAFHELSGGNNAT